MRNLIICTLLFFFLILDYSLSRCAENNSVYMGYTKSLHGGGFDYHSLQPDITKSMLIRSISSKEYIEWETETIPGNLNADSVEFIWMFGIDANIDSHEFKLYLNNLEIVTFSNPLISEKVNWVCKGLKGSSLTFKPLILDKFNDPMGYAFLRVPRSLIISGKPQVLKITGEDAGSRSWYMTFEAGINESVRIVQSDAVIRKDGKLMQPVNFQFSHLGNSIGVRIEIQGAVVKELNIDAGYTSVEILMPLTEKEENYTAGISFGNSPVKTYTFTTSPPHHYTFYFVQHAHTDIGYTRPQTEILPEHLRFIDYALDYCDKTDNYPDASKFRWTCETSWPVREYLNSRPAVQVERLKKRIREGRIEVTGLFLNMSDLYDENILKSSLEPVKLFRKEGIPVKTGMQDDVNGAAWILVDYLKDAGISYLTMGQNDGRALKPFDKPTVFWWESPAGNRILTFRGEHYMHGNYLGILTNDMNAFEKNIFKYINDLQHLNYNYEDICLQFSGYLTDNSPPSTNACELIRSWNEKYEWPKLRLSTISEFPAIIESKYSDKLPVIRGAWPDWWSDGFGSTAIETANGRKSQTDFIANLGLLSMCKFSGSIIPEYADKLISDIRDDLAFWDEHTFTAAESITDPLAENTYVQWGQKAANIWDAVKKNSLLRETAMGLIQGRAGKENVPSLVVFNPLNVERSGTTVVYIDHQILPTDKAFSIVDIEGKTVRALSLSGRDDGNYWAFYLDKLPAFGYKTYRIEVSKQFPAIQQKKKFEGLLENQYYRIQFDTVKGGIRSFIDKESGKELVDPDAPWLLGQFIYERLGKNRNQLELKRLDEVERSSLTNLRFSKYTIEGIWQSITMTGLSKECADMDGVNIEFRLYETEKRLEIMCSMKKLPLTDPEAVYIAFPFKLKNSDIHYDVQGGDVVAGKDQIEGSSADWCAVQNYAAVKSSDFQIILSSPEIPLMQFGDLNIGKFQRKTVVKNPYIFSWVLNNYWTTNFLASQQGELKWSYEITSSKDTSNKFRTIFGWSSRIPFPARVIPASANSFGEKNHSFLPAISSDLLLIVAEPLKQSDSVQFSLREIGGKAATVTNSEKQTFIFKPFESKSVNFSIK